MTISNSKEFLKEVKRHPSRFYIIHYSCQNLNDSNEGLSPRITSIAVVHYATQHAVSFSTHAIAEELGISRGNVHQDFDRIENELLKRFFSFVMERRDKYWVHWNMRHLSYGFEHLEHRFRTLGNGEAPLIPVERRINLNDILEDRYGDNYAEHPRMQPFMNMNGGIPKGFLSGAEEVKAFREARFLEMHNSTLSKVSFFRRVIEKMLDGKLKTASKGWGVMLDRLFEGRLAKAIGFFSAIFGILLAIWEGLKLVGI